MRMNMDEKRIRCVLKSLVTELENSQEAWPLSRELYGQLEGEPLAQVLHSRLPDADHRDAAGKMAAAVEDMYKGMDGQDTGEALALAAARYILSREERENPYVLGLTAVDLIEGRRLLDMIKTGADLTWSEKSSAFLAYYSVFLRKGSLMASESLAKALERLLGINRGQTEAHPVKNEEWSDGT